MTNPEGTTRPITNADVREIMDNIGECLGFSKAPEFICYGQPTWVAIGSGTTSPEDTLAIRLRHTTDPEQSLIDTAEQVDLMRRLRKYGAQVVAFLDEPWIEQGSDSMPGAFIASLSQYLPGKATDYQYGGAIASLHNASSSIDLSRYDHMDPLRSITSVEAAITFAEQKLTQGAPVQIGKVAVTEEHVEKLWRTFGTANDLRTQLFELAERNRSPLVVVQEDVYSNNAGTDYNGVGTLMDVDPFVAPAAMDFGRVMNDWQRFRMPDANHASRFLDGYTSTIASGKLPRNDELELAMRYSDHRTPLMVASLAINGVRTGHQGDEWQLGEGLRRLDTIGMPEQQWFADDNARRIADRAQLP